MRELVDSGKMDKSTAKTIEDGLLQQEITAKVLFADLGVKLMIKRNSVMLTCL